MPDPLRDVPKDAIELIKSFEGIPDGDPSTVNLDAYLDPIGIWTIGWGHAIRAPDGKDWLRGPPNKPVARSLYPGGITKAQAETLLHADLLDTTRDVLRLVKVALNDGQLGGLLAFVFNLGAGSLASSTLLKLLNTGDYAGAADQFLVWNKAKVNGVLTPMAGLTRRRTGERALFAGEDWRAASAARGAVPVAAKKAAGKKAAAKKLAPTAAKKAPAKNSPVRKVCCQRGGDCRARTRRYCGGQRSAVEEGGGRAGACKQVGGEEVGNEDGSNEDRGDEEGRDDCKVGVRKKSGADRPLNG